MSRYVEGATDIVSREEGHDVYQQFWDLPYSVHYQLAERDDDLPVSEEEENVFAVSKFEVELDFETT